MESGDPTVSYSKLSESDIEQKLHACSLRNAIYFCVKCLNLKLSNILKNRKYLKEKSNEVI